MQAGLLGRAEAVEFIHSYHHHRVAAVHCHPLWPTRGGEPDDLAEPRLGFPPASSGEPASAPWDVQEDPPSRSTK